MIDIVHMPVESRKFAVVLECMKLRQQSFEETDFWIGQSGTFPGQLEQVDREESYHIINHDGDVALGYGRLRPVCSSLLNDTTSNMVHDIARKSSRFPALELQRVSAINRCRSGDATESRENIMREIFLEAFRIANTQGIKFLYVCSDRGGTLELRHLGLRYSTLSTPCEIKGRSTVILCIAVSNSNFSAISHLRVVGGKDFFVRAAPLQTTRANSFEQPSVFDQREALVELFSEEGIDPLP